MKILRMIAMICLALLLMIATAMPQSSGGVKEQKRQVIVHATSGAAGEMHVSVQGPEDALIGMKTVKGAPYSAETKSETVQTLANGNRIIRRNSARIFRDGEGRTRQEYCFNQTGEPGTADLISISDPVAGVSYTLHPAAKTAEKVALPGDLMPIAEGIDGTQVLHSGHAQVFMRKIAGPDAAPAPSLHTAIERNVMIHTPGPNQAREEFASEALGTRVMEGIQVEGKRTTLTLPAGAIGNEQPIVTVTETWYSPELQTTLYSRREDPMAGTTVFQATKLIRGEPDASLFQLPPGFTVNEAKVDVIRKIERAP